MPSKLSVHLSAFPERTFDIIERIRPSVIKVFNFPSDQNMDQIRRRSPSTIIIYRHYSDVDYHNPADRFFAEMADTLNKLRGRGIYWEGVNEPVVHSVQDAQALNNWFVRFADLMHAQGEKVAAFSWSTGNPLNLAEVAPLVANAAAACDLHAFHEYYSIWGKSRDWVRYRAFEQALPVHARKPVVITEAGIDDNGDAYTGGYRNKVSNDQYVEIMKAYDYCMLQDPYCLGATIFQWGDFAWPSFEISPVIDHLADYITSTGGGVVIPRPFPVPQFQTAGPTYSFSASPPQILAGQSSTLRWDAEGVRGVYFNDASVANHGTRVVQPNWTTTYTLRIVLADGTVKELQATVTVKTSAPAPTYSFTANPSSIVAGKSSTLKWDVEGVREVYLNNEGVTGHETRTVSPKKTTNYKLHIVFLDGTVKDLTVTIQVTAPPVPTPNQPPERVTPPTPKPNPTPNPAPIPPSPATWDARLTPLGIKIEPASKLPAWKVILGKFVPAAESGGNHHVFIKALRADGTPISGLRFVVDWVYRDPSDDPAFVTTNPAGEANCALWASITPGRTDGIYFLKPADDPGDSVKGLGLPGGEHVSYQFTFKYTAS